jgi:hypothetical protein
MAGSIVVRAVRINHERSSVVSHAVRRLRSLLIAIAALAVSATVALAGRSALSGQGQQVASQHRDGGAQAAETETGADEAEAPDADAPEAEAPDPDSQTAGVHPDNHGKLVSDAAQGATPDGFDNHGAYIRTIAQANHGHADAATKHADKTSH